MRKWTERNRCAGRRIAGGEERGGEEEKSFSFCLFLVLYGSLGGFEFTFAIPEGANLGNAHIYMQVQEKGAGQTLDSHVHAFEIQEVCLQIKLFFPYERYVMKLFP